MNKSSNDYEEKLREYTNKIRSNDFYTNYLFQNVVIILFLHTQ